ncbi:hypothetical protein GW17_00014742 [Ensete ventricosum]|nr:hypothetical protein GW17_00014742 [Ensete ventricosum]
MKIEGFLKKQPVTILIETRSTKKFMNNKPPCQGVGVTAFAADTAPAGGSFMGATPAGVPASNRPCGLAMAWLQAVQAAANSPFAGGLGRGQATYSRGRPPL